LTPVIECGGDTDSTGAIVGGIVGTSVGQAGILAE
jgi:ADP-ribosylglycohydrolase